MKKTFFLFIFLLLAASASKAQTGNSVFNFLELPVSAHATALGGQNISLIEDDASLVFLNPALLSSVSDNTLNLNYMTYMQGCNVASAALYQDMRRAFHIRCHRAICTLWYNGRNNGSQRNHRFFLCQDMALSGM